jgi:galactose mutarotase-like enzyme
LIKKLGNEFLEVLADAKGAELTSIKGKKDNVEYLWKADPIYWNRHAPILFPIVGKVKDNKYKIGDKQFYLGQHGFARDNEFKVISESSNKVIFCLSSSEETLKKYPFKFQLDVEYYLVDNNLRVTYKVKNTDQEKIFFSIGAHPGFNCPLIESETMEDYYLEFSQIENANIEFVNPGTGLLTGVKELYLKSEKIINLDKDLFKKDALVFKELNSSQVSIKSHKNSKKVTVNFEGFPYLGIWSKPSGAPFVCIEPWFGHADFENFNGDFREKEGIIGLEKDKEFTSTYCIAIEQ